MIDRTHARGLNGLPEDTARWLFPQLIVAVDYCHRLGIANRDIKVHKPCACATALA